MSREGKGKLIQKGFKGISLKGEKRLPRAQGEGDRGNLHGERRELEFSGKKKKGAEVLKGERTWT